MLRKYWKEGLIFLSFFLLYAATASRTVIQGDTGEFLSVAAVGGVAHPPGYPLYSFIVWLIYGLSKNAWITNLSSSVFGALTLIIVFRVTKLLTKKDIPSLFAALALGTYEVFWFYSLVTQIHIFYVFIESLILYSLLFAVQKKTAKQFYITSFLLGLGIATHQVVAFLFPACLYTLYIVKKSLSTKTIALCIPIGLTGLLSYLYIVLASGNNPPVNWGEVHDLQSLLRLFLRFDYGIFLLSKAESGAPFAYSTFVFYFKDLFIKSWFLIPFAIASVALLRRDKLYNVVFLSFIFMGPFYYLLMNIPNRSIIYQSTIEQYIPYSFLFFAILCGVGLSVLQEKIFSIKKELLFAIAITFFTLLVFAELPKINLTNNTLAYDTTHFQLSQIPKGGIVLTWSDSIYLPSSYVQYVEKKRSDIIFIQLGLVNTPWYKDHITKLHPKVKDLFTDGFDYKKACKEYGDKNLLFIYPYFTEYASIFGDDCEVIPFGLVNKVITKNSNVDINKVKKENDELWKKYISQVNPVSYRDRSTRTQEALFYLAEQKNHTGTYYLSHNNTSWALVELEESKRLSSHEVNALISESVIFFNAKKVDQAISVLNEAERRAPATQDVYKNRGLIYGKIGQEENAYTDLKRYVEFNPIDPQLEAIKSFLGDHERKTGQTISY